MAGNAELNNCVRGFCIPDVQYIPCVRVKVRVRVEKTTIILILTLTLASSTDVT